MPKKAFSLIVFCMITFSQLKSQLIIEHLYKISKNYTPFFGNEKGALNISLELSHGDGRDSILSLVIDINQRKVKLEGTVTGLSAGIGASSGSWGLIGALAGSFSSNNKYSFINTQGVVVLDYKSFDSLEVILNKIKIISSQPNPYDKTVLFKVNKIRVGVDLRNEKLGNITTVVKEYYFQIDESTFKLSEDEFKELCANSFDVLKISFDEFNKNRSIQVPVN